MSSERAALLVADAMEQSSLMDDAQAVLAALRAALTEGDADVAEALGLAVELGACRNDARIHRVPDDCESPRRLVTDWMQAQ